MRILSIITIVLAFFAIQTAQAGTATKKDKAAKHKTAKQAKKVAKKAPGKRVAKAAAKPVVEKPKVEKAPEPMHEEESFDNAAPSEDHSMDEGDSESNE